MNSQHLLLLFLLLLKIKRLEWNYARMMQGHFTYSIKCVSMVRERCKLWKFTEKFLYGTLWTKFHRTSASAFLSGVLEVCNSFMAFRAPASTADSTWMWCRNSSMRCSTDVIGSCWLAETHKKTIVQSPAATTTAGSCLTSTMSWDPLLLTLVHPHTQNIPVIH